jgi:ATP-dependent RNA helicase DDX41
VFIKQLTTRTVDAQRERYRLAVEGQDIPFLIRSFADMRFPLCLVAGLRKIGIERPSPLQMQALPVALSGRDLIAVGPTGCGKTLAFALPLVLFAVETAMDKNSSPADGPIGLIICASVY